MSTKVKQQAQNPLILRCHRLMEAFAKSDDERDFYLDRMEGFLVFVDNDKSEEELERLDSELKKNNDRYCMIPKMTFYETKKIMEGFVNEKVYDIDTKEKLLEIIQSKEARENFLEFIYDHHSELEKWQQYYQERSRIRIIEWLRQNHYEFVFEEDLELPRDILEKLKNELFEVKASKEVLAARKSLFQKAKTYYSNEALNPRPKRGRPPKQVTKLEVEPQVTTDIFITVPSPVRPFLFTPDYTHGASIIFSTKFENEEQLMARKKTTTSSDYDVSLESLNQKLSLLRSLSNRWTQEETNLKKPGQKLEGEEEFEEEEEDLDVEEEDWDSEDEELDSEEEFEEEKPAPKAVKTIEKSKPAPKAKPKAVPVKKPAKAAPAKTQKVKPLKRKLAPLKKKLPAAKPKTASKKTPAGKAPLKKLTQKPKKGKK